MKIFYYCMLCLRATSKQKDDRTTVYCCTRIPEKWSPKNGPREKWSPEKWSPRKMVPGKMVPAKNGPRKIGHRKIGPGKIGLRKIGRQKNDPRKIGPRKNGCQKNVTLKISASDKISEDLLRCRFSTLTNCREMKFFFRLRFYWKEISWKTITIVPVVVQTWSGAHFLRCPIF